MSKEVKLVLKNGQEIVMHVEEVSISNGKCTTSFKDHWGAEYYQGELKEVQIECTRTDNVLEFSLSKLSKILGKVVKDKSFFDPVEEEDSNIVALAIPKDPELLLRYIVDLMESTKHDMAKRDLMKAMTLSFCKDMVPQYGSEAIHRIIMFVTDHY